MTAGGPGAGPAVLDRAFDRLAEREWDLLVVGGGVNGAGVARDAARRGLAVALVEKEDFAYGTTGRSTRLIHGGLRYLALYDFRLVRESLRERELLLRNAPHLVRPLRFLVPVYRGSKPGAAKLRLGLLLYDVLSYDKSLPNHRWLAKEEVLAEEPGLNPVGLEGALCYWDGQIPFVERLVVENALDAAAHGAVLANHAEVERLLLDGDTVRGAVVRDLLGEARIEVRARLVVNAAGPWLPDLLPRPVSAAGKSPVRNTKGVHLVVPAHTQSAVVLFSPDDNRLFFSIPWAGRSLVGTTDTEFSGGLEGVRADPEEVRYLLRGARAVFPRLPDAVDYTYAGIRSLLNVEGVSEGEITRRHLVLDHAAAEGTHGLVSVVGGKITPYRQVCEETADVTVRRLGLGTGSDTDRAPLPGAPPVSASSFETWVAHIAAGHGDREAAAHAARLYGRRAERVLAIAAAHPSLGARVCEHGPDLWAGVRFAVEEEMARTLADALLRRTTVGFAPCVGLHVAREAARFVAPLLGWTPEREAAEAEAYLREAGLRTAFRGEG